MGVSLGSFPLRLAEQAGEQRHEGDADEGDTAAGHKLLHALRFGARVVVSVTLHQVDRAPDGEACAKGYYQGLQYGYRAVEECHNSCCRNRLGV